MREWVVQVWGTQIDKERPKITLVEVVKKKCQSDREHNFGQDWMAEKNKCDQPWLDRIFTFIMYFKRAWETLLGILY